MKLSFSKIAVAVAVMLATFGASAEYLYAFIKDATDLYNPGHEIVFDYATFTMVSTGEKIPISTGNSVLSAGTAAGTGASSSTETAFYVGDDNTTFNTFLVELWLTGDPTRVAWQQYSTSEVTGHILQATGGGGDNYFTISQVIPEPTSGLMLLFGLAGLALRRKRA